MVAIDMKTPNTCMECPFCFIDTENAMCGCDIMFDLEMDFSTYMGDKKDENCPLINMD